MAVIRPLSESDPIQFLILERFPALSWFQRAGRRKSYDMSAEEQKELSDLSEAYREELLALPRLELLALVSQATFAEEMRRDEAKQLEELKRFYNQPEAIAEWARWASAAYWTLDEVTALSFGKDPRVVTWKALAPCEKIWPFTKAFADRRDLLGRAKFMGQLWHETIPSIVLAWAERTRFPMPPELITEVKALGIQIADWKSLFDDQKAIAARKSEEIAALEQVVNALNLRIQTVGSFPPDNEGPKQLGLREPKAF